MPMTKEQAQAEKRRVIAEVYGGDEDAYRQAMSERGKKGGKIGRTGGFYADRRKASIAGRRGGLRSAAKRKRNGDGQWT